MSRILENQLRNEIPEIIRSWFDGEKGKVSFEKRTAKGGHTADVIHDIAGYRFIIECKNAASSGLVADAIKNLQKLLAEMPEAAKETTTVPLVAVPFMGEAGRELCRREKISWLDLSGNASVTAPRLKIQIEGKPNRFKSAGRPKNLFAPKSSRIARTLLINPEIALTQRELARKTRLNETLVGRVVRELERENFLQRDESGAVRAREPGLLLDAWAESYQFERHALVYGFMAQRTGEAVMRAAAESLEKNRIEYAATGLAGAWLLSHFAAFRVASFYLKEMPSLALLEKLKITEQSKAGGNLWLIVPNDDGVFEGASERDGSIRCAHPVQVYLDLKFHPERAREAQEAVRGEYLAWENDRK